MSTEGKAGASAPADLLADGIEQAVQQRFARIDRRLQQLENGIADLEARLPAMRREAAAIREELSPPPKETHE